MDCVKLKESFKDFLASGLEMIWHDSLTEPFFLSTVPEPGGWHWDLCLEFSIDEHFGCRCLSITDLQADFPGRGVGVKAIDLIKQFCDKHKLPLVIQNAFSGFWDRPEYEWLASRTEPERDDRWLIYRHSDWQTPNEVWYWLIRDEAPPQ